MGRHRAPIPNGCGTSWSAWVPDSRGNVAFRDCCDQHDLDWGAGGLLGGILPWRIDGQWEARFWRSNLGLSQCIRARFAEKGQTLRGLLWGPLYFTAVSTVGLAVWKWRSFAGWRVPTSDELALALVTLTNKEATMAKSKGKKPMKKGSGKGC